LTGQDDPSMDMMAMAEGAAGYLCKQGLTASQLENSIRQALQK